MKTNQCRQQRAFIRETSSRSFTLIELLTVVAIVALMAGLLLPALSAGKAKALQVKCASNHRQLALSWQLYALDNGEWLTRNGYIAANGEVSRPMWVQGYYNHSSSPTDSTNLSLLVDPRYAQFAAYLTAGDVSVYRCPANRKGVLIEGILYPRWRSVGMNWALGWIETRAIQIPEDVFLKTSDIQNTSRTLLITDVDNRSICWPFFGIYATNSFQMFPGAYHQNGTVASFCDGHVELKVWKDTRTISPEKWGNWHSHNYPVRGGENRDLLWLQERRGLR